MVTPDFITALQPNEILCSEVTSQVFTVAAQRALRTNSLAQNGVWVLVARDNAMPFRRCKAAQKPLNPMWMSLSDTSNNILN